MQDKVLGGVAKGKVVGGQLGLLCVKCALVAGQPSLVAQHGRGVDQGALQVNVDIGIGLDVLMAVGHLELAALVAVKYQSFLIKTPKGDDVEHSPRLRGKVTLQGELQTLEQLILDSDLGEQSVVCVPLLSQG